MLLLIFLFFRYVGHPEGKIGLDLVSLNIQRGRDHGIPNYVALREALGLPAIESFENVTSDIGLQEALREVYGSIDLIDAWVGGLAEDHIPGGMVGLTFATIISDQFYRSMCGDPYFYLWDPDIQDNEVLRDYVLNVDEISLAQIFAFNTEMEMTGDENVMSMVDQM